MQGFEIRFNVYAESQEEADAATRAIITFINERAKEGVAVTASKLTEAVNRYKDNYFVTKYFK